MKKISFRMPLIFLLLVISLVQVMRLWFDETSNRNFFYNFEEFNAVSTGEILNEDTAMLDPSILATYYPQREEFYLIKKTRVEFENILLNSRRLIQHILTEGENQGVTLVNWDEFWENRSFVMKLPYEMTYAMLIEDSQIVKSVEEETYTFNYIVLVPTDARNNDILCYLVNAKLGQVMTLSLNNGQEEELYHNKYLVTLFGELLDKQSFPVYVGTKKLGLKMFSQNAFLPIEDMNVYYNQSMRLRHPFYLDNQLDESALEAYVNQFFVNPASKFVLQDGDTWTYRDEQTVVKYNNLGIIEYTNLNNQEHGDNMSLPKAYRQVIEFLNQDSDLQSQEYYLQEYEQDYNGINFYFNYSFNDFNYVLGEGLKETLNIQVPIEIRVEGNQVTYYKRWLVEKEVNLYDYQELEIDYKEALDYYFEEYPNQKALIEDMYLAYYIEDVETDTRLYWVIESDKKYIMELK